MFEVHETEDIKWNPDSSDSWQVKTFASNNNPTYRKSCDYECYLEDDARHSQCLFEPRNDSLCSNLLIHNDGIEAKMVELHNELRDKIAGGWYEDSDPPYLKNKFPTSGDMREMKWDPQLADSALKWGRTCPKTTDECRDVKLSGEKQYFLNQADIPSNRLMRAEQLISWVDWDVSETQPSMQSIFASWREQLVNLSFGVIVKYKNNKDGLIYDKAAQIIWAKTYLVGCASVSFDNKSKPGFRIWVLICNYAPRGLIDSRPIYSIGGACSACEPLHKTGTAGKVCSRKSLSLCATGFETSLHKMGLANILPCLIFMFQINWSVSSYKSFFLIALRENVPMHYSELV